MASTGPRSEVFTTVLVNEHGEVADWPAHRQRLSEHAVRLRLNLPNEDPGIDPPPNRKLGPCSHRFRRGRRR